MNNFSTQQNSPPITGSSKQQPLYSLYTLVVCLLEGKWQEGAFLSATVVIYLKMKDTTRMLAFDGLPSWKIVTLLKALDGFSCIFVGGFSNVFPTGIITERIYIVP